MKTNDEIEILDFLEQQINNLEEYDLLTRRGLVQKHFTEARDYFAEYEAAKADQCAEAITADRNKLIKHLAFQLGEDEEHLRALAENIGSAPPAL